MAAAVAPVEAEGVVVAEEAGEMAEAVAPVPAEAVEQERAEREASAQAPVKAWARERAGARSAKAAGQAPRRVPPLPPDASASKRKSRIEPPPPAALESSAKIGRPIVNHRPRTRGSAIASGARRERWIGTTLAADSRRTSGVVRRT